MFSGLLLDSSGDRFFDGLNDDKFGKEETSGTTKRPRTKVNYKNFEDTESELGSDDDNDDATVQLEELKKEHSKCFLRVEEFEEKIKKMRNDLKTYQKEMAKKREAVASLKAEVEELKSLNLNLQRQLLKRSSGQSLVLWKATTLCFDITVLL